MHELAEIDTPAFREFVEQAAAAYLERVDRQDKADPAEIMPWKVLGRKWHESRKGFPSNKRVKWNPGVAEQLFNLLEQTLRGDRVRLGQQDDRVGQGETTAMRWLKCRRSGGTGCISRC